MKRGAPRARARLGSWVALLASNVALLLAAMEVTYRVQSLDFYAKELESFNPPAALTGKGAPVILALGDSFTAGNHSYVSWLRRDLPGLQWVNGGISGSGVKEALLVAPRRFSRFEPRVLIYQVYVGNDLVDMGYRTDWSRLSIGRNLWWTISRWLPSIPFLRRRMQEAWSPKASPEAETPAAPDDVGIDTSERFSPAAYTERVRLYYTLDPEVTDESIRLGGARAATFQEYAPLVKKLTGRCRPPACQPLVFVVPHKSQVSREYYEWERQLGADLPDDSITIVEDYPFVRALRSALEPAGVPVLNPLSFLREKERERHVYFVNDDHLNAFGQAQLAVWLRSELANRFALIAVR